MRAFLDPRHGPFLPEPAGPKSKVKATSLAADFASPGETQMIEGFDNIGVAVTDYRAAVDFYGKLL